MTSAHPPEPNGARPGPDIDPLTVDPLTVDPLTVDPLTVDTARCTWETLEGETLVIDTTTGTLVVLRGLATAVWQALTAGEARVADLVADASARYGADIGSSLAAVLDGVRPLLHRTDTVPAVVDWPTAAEPPVIERFDEIADILTLDPIHDVAPDSGWPFEPGRGTA